MNLVIKMLITLGIIGAVSGASLATLSDWAAPKIAEHRKKETEKAIFLVQPSAKSYEKVEGIDFELFKVFDESGAEVGYALPFEGNGFQGVIRLMVGVNPDATQITAMEVLEQVETPGLGTKILEEPFKGQFNELSASPQIDWVKGESPDKDNEVQTITGATISSKAVVEIVNKGVERLRQYKESGAAL